MIKFIDRIGAEIREGNLLLLRQNDQGAFLGYAKTVKHTLCFCYSSLYESSIGIIELKDINPNDITVLNIAEFNERIGKSQENRWVRYYDKNGIALAEGMVIYFGSEESGNELLIIKDKNELKVKSGETTNLPLYGVMLSADNYKDDVILDFIPNKYLDF